MGRGRLERILDNEVYHYRSIDPSLLERAHPKGHKPLADTPEVT